MEPRVALAIGVLENGQMIGIQEDHSPNSWRASSRSASRIFRPSSSTSFEIDPMPPAAAFQPSAVPGVISFRGRMPLSQERQLVNLAALTEQYRIGYAA
jgi:hypothetical protein